MAVKKSIAIIGEGETEWWYSELIASMNTEESDKTSIKPKNQNRNKENRRQIIGFIVDNGISDSKSISKAIELKYLSSSPTILIMHFF